MITFSHLPLPPCFTILFIAARGSIWLWFKMFPASKEHRYFNISLYLYLIDNKLPCKFPFWSNARMLFELCQMVSNRSRIALVIRTLYVTSFAPASRRFAELRLLINPVWYICCPVDRGRQVASVRCSIASRWSDVTGRSPTARWCWHAADSTAVPNEPDLEKKQTVKQTNKWINKQINRRALLVNSTGTCGMRLVSPLATRGCFCDLAVPANVLSALITMLQLTRKGHTRKQPLHMRCAYQSQVGVTDRSTYTAFNTANGVRLDERSTSLGPRSVQSVSRWLGARIAVVIRARSDTRSNERSCVRQKMNVSIFLEHWTLLKPATLQWKVPTQKNSNRSCEYITNDLSNRARIPFVMHTLNSTFQMGGAT